MGRGDRGEKTYFSGVASIECHEGPWACDRQGLGDRISLRRSLRVINGREVSYCFFF